MSLFVLITSLRIFHVSLVFFIFFVGCFQHGFFFSSPQIFLEMFPVLFVRLFVEIIRKWKVSLQQLNFCISGCKEPCRHNIVSLLLESTFQKHVSIHSRMNHMQHPHHNIKKKFLPSSFWLKRFWICKDWFERKFWSSYVFADCFLLLTLSMKVGKW